MGCACKGNRNVSSKPAARVAPKTGNMRAGGVDVAARSENTVAVPEPTMTSVKPGIITPESEGIVPRKEPLNDPRRNPRLITRRLK